MTYYLVTGASSGIGREVARKLSGEDTTIVLVARREERLKKLQSELPGESIIQICDCREADQVEKVFENLKELGIKLDGMVYCAGVCFVKTIKIMEKAELEDMFRINVFGFYEMCRHFCRRNASNKGGSIVGISSYAARMKESGFSAYSMSKEAMNVQVQVLAKEFLKRKIRINTVMPANVMSKMAEEQNVWSEDEIREIEQKQPLGIIPIENVVKLVTFLLSEDAKYITGETIAISGGYHG